ncbi:MAG: glycerate kinase [Candidatus Caldatribacteriaceae bacterium]
MNLEEKPLRVWGPLGGKVTVTLLFPEEGALFFDAGSLLKEWDPLFSTTYGVGEVLLEACVLGVEYIAVQVPGRFLYDGGMGMLEALGVRFFDVWGRELSGMGDNLKRVASLDPSGLVVKPENLGVEIIVGSGKPSSCLEKNAQHFARVVERFTGERVFLNHGGVGMSLEAFWGAKVIGGEGF